MAQAATTKSKTAVRTRTAAKVVANAPKHNGGFAVIASGGKQYVVSVGDIVDIERLPNAHKEGDAVEFDTVLLVDNGTDATIGTPYITGAKVTAVYQGEKKGKKLTIVRFKAKSNRDRKIGHRQKYARVKIESLS